MIKAVLFDYGGVLSSGGKNFRSAVAEILGIEPDQVKTDHVGMHLWDGQVDAEQFFAELSKQHGKKITAEDFSIASRITDKNQKVYNLAAQLREHGIKTGILSNMYKSSADLLRQKGLYDDFDPIVLSYEENMSKPNPVFYQHALSMLGCEPSEVLFIDDQERFITPAQKLGIHTVCADTEERIIVETKAIVQKENGLTL